MVSGWGEGELWIGGGLVLANDFQFSRAARKSPAAEAVSTAPKGATRPPLNTVASVRAQVVDGSVTRLHQHVDVDGVVQRIQRFLAGERVELSDVPLDLAPLSPFQRSVAEALRAVPRGEAVTYGELAALAGHPGAQRAVGTLCARNPFIFLMPCHRVVAASGIGSYGSAGVAVKRRLLALEGVVL